MNKISANLSDTKPDVPEVGMGATERVGSDSYAYTIIEVSKSKKRIVVQRDRSIRVDSNGQSEAQEYRYEKDPEGPTALLSLRKGNRWERVGSKSIWGCGFGIGYRRTYHDPSF